ncbi:MAG: hypothetical protein IPP31_00635 [Chitinophagaceae bacterium]|nr:hypothetical protein [Chitinophagaceae bacterium]
MIRTLWILLVFAFLASCNQKDGAPDVSGIKVDLKTQHFEKDLFSPDSADLSIKLDRLQAAYPSFGENFFNTILNCDPRWPADTLRNYVQGFISAYQNVYDTAEVVFRDFKPYENDIRKGLQYVKYYFPEYRFPTRVITYIGPLDGYGDILTDDAIIVGLHHHLGKNYSLYRSGIVQETYPDYISRRFEPGTIGINCIRNIVLDLFPENMADKPLVQQMVEKGKRLYVMAKLLPQTEEYKLIGYTREQLEGAYKNEASIWNLFVQNNFLQSIDNNIIKNYVNEGPKTQELGEASPGNIGSFAGWQIVKKYMQKNPGKSLIELMRTDAETLFQEAKYKP